MIFIHKYENLFDETPKTLEAEKAHIVDFIEKDKQYLIIINDNEYIYPKRKRFPKLKDGDIVSIRPIPGGMSEAGGAMGLVGGILTAIGGILLATGAGAVAGGILLGLGAVMIAAGTTVQMLAPKQKDTKTSFKQGYGFSAGGNEIGKDKPFPVIFGSRRHTPPIVGMYYTRSETAYWTEEIKHYWDVEVCTDWRRVSDGESAGGMVNECFAWKMEKRHIDSTFITHGGPSQDLHALFCLGYGKIHIKDIRMGDTLLAANDIDVTNGIIPMTSQVVAAQFEIRQGALPDLYRKRKSMDAIGAALENDEAEKNVVIERNIPAGATSVDVEIAYLQGLYFHDSKKGYVHADSKIAIEVYSGNTLLSKFEFYVRENKNNELRYTQNYPLPPSSQPLKIKVWALLKTINVGSFSVLPTIVSLVYNFNEDVVSASVASKMTFLAMKITADANTNGAIDKINCIASSLIPVYTNGNWNTKALSSNPAAIALDMLRGGYLARKVPDEMIDFDEFQKVYSWCDNGSRPYKCNMIIDEQSTFIDIVNKPLALCQANFVIKNGKYSIAHDRKRDTPLAVLTPKNTRDFQSQIFTDEIPTAIKITFNDEQANFEETEVTVTLVGEAAGENIISAKPEGLTSFQMANNFGRYMLAVRRNRPEKFTCTVPLYHYYLPIGSRVRIQQFSILVGLASGRITNIDAVNNVIFIDERISELDEAKNYGMQIVVGLGNIEEVRLEPMGTPNAFKVIGGIAKPEYSGKVYAFGEWDKKLKILDCIIKSKGGISTQKYTAQLELVPYSEEIFNAINEAIPPYNPSVTTPGKPIGDEIYQERPRPSSPGDNAIGVKPDGSVEIGGADLGAIIDTIPPTDIWSISVVPRSNGSISVKWGATEDNENGSGLAGYKIYRCENEDKSGKYIHMYAGANDAEAQDTATVLNKAYYYGVSAYDRNNNESNITWLDTPITAKNVIPPDKPSNMRAKALKGEIRTEWDAPVNAGEITYYGVEKRLGLSDDDIWQVLGRSGTLAYSETIGKIEKSGILNWRYRVRAYNLYETYSDYDSEDGVAADVSEYGTFEKMPLTPELTAVGDSIVIGWAKQYNLMDFKAVHIQVSRDGLDWYDLSYKGENPTEIEKGSFTETVTTITHGSLTLDKEAIITDGETQYLPVKTLYKYRMRQVSEDGEALDWNDEFTPIAEIYAEPLDILKLNVGNLSVQGGKFLSMQGGTMKGFAKDDNLPISQRIEAGDASLNYWDLTNNKMRLGTLGNYMLVDYAKNLVAFKGTELQLDQSSLTTNADNIYLKHEGRGLTWGNEDFSIEHGKITADAKNLKIKASEIKLEGNNIQISGNLLAPVIKATNKIESKQFLSSWGAGGGYSFVSDGGFGTGMYSDADGDLYFKKNNVKQDINSLLGGALSIAKGGTGATTADAARTALGAASMDHLHNNVSLFRFFGLAYTNIPGLDHLNTYEPPNAIHVPGITWDFVEQRDTNLTKLPTKDAFLLTIEASIYRGFQLCFDWVTNRRWSRIRHDDTGQGRWGGWREF